MPPSSGGVGNSSTAGRGAHAPQETCIHCHGARWVRVDVPFGHPRFGEIQPCTCWNDETQDDRRDRLIRYSNLGALARFNFSALLPAGRSSEPEQQRLFREAVTAAWAFAENPAGRQLRPVGIHLVVKLGDIGLSEYQSRKQNQRDEAT